MLEFLVSWAEQLIIALIIIIMVELIIPNSNYRKYIKVILGIFIIYTIFSPLISGKTKQIDFGEVFSYQEENNSNIQVKNQIDYDKQIETVYIEKLKETLTQDLKEKGYEIKDINIELTYEKEEIKIKKIKFKIFKFEQNQNITIEKVQIKQDTKVDEQKIKQIKEEISSTYNIEISKIFIESGN